MSDTKDLLKLRKTIKKHKPDYIRQDYYKKKKLKKNKWRHARGIHSKIRLSKRGHIKKNQVGYKSPKIVRGLHKTGLKPKIVKSLKDILSINKENEGAIIASSVGSKKKIELIKKLKASSITILNINADEYLKKIEEVLKRRKEGKESRKKIKEKRKKEKEKEKKSEEEKEEPREELAEKIQKEEKEKEKKEKDKFLTKRV